MWYAEGLSKRHALDIKLFTTPSLLINLDICMLKCNFSTIMSEHQTIIIGAGPAGLACATILAKHGRKVIVLERNKTVGPKVCAGGVPFHAFKRLNLPNNLAEKTFPVQHIITPFQKARLKSKIPIISTVNRKKLGRLMMAQATRAGVIVKTGTTVTRITNREVYTKDNSFQYQYLVGADGSSSIVRRFLNISSRFMGVGIQYQVPGNFEKMEWHFAPKSFKSGYAWIFPHKKLASIGAYAERSDITPQNLMRQLHLWAENKGIKFNNCRPEASTINFDFRGWHFNNIFLTGDAAGLASGLTGEGILPAVISGEAAAKAIITPGYHNKEMAQLIHKQQRHQQVQKLFAKNKVICHIALEMLVLALRMQIIPFSSLEMG
jgi:geranylgeranyl reductase family protein